MVHEFDGTTASSAWPRRCRGCSCSGFLIAALLGLVTGLGWMGWQSDPEPVWRVAVEVCMSATVGDLNPKTLENAKRQFVEVYGSALVLNTYLKIALVLVSLVALGLLGLNFHTAARYSQVKPLVIRIDEVGRAEAVAYDASRYQPQPPELRYFLTQFVVKHFSRIRATVQREYPDSLLFLEPALADATIAQNDQSRSIEDVRDEPVRRRDRCRRPERQPERADDDAVQGRDQFPEGLLHAWNAARAGRETFVAQVDFVLRDHVPNAFVRVNPLGLQVVVLPRRSGVRGGVTMIANSAFLAGLTVFLVAAWLAGELSFLAPYKATLFRQHGWFIGGVALVAVLQPVRPLLQRGAMAVPSGFRSQTPSPRPPVGNT